MAQPPVAADVHQPLDVHGHLPPEIAFNPHLFVDKFANPVDLFVSQVSHARIRIDVRPLEQSLAGVQPDPIDVWQRRFNPLIAR